MVKNILKIFSAIAVFFTTFILFQLTENIERIYFRV
jgi:hypothetical protein